MFPKHFGIACLGILPAFAPVAQAPQAPPQVKVNVLNVCTPSADEQKEIDSALAKVPKEPAFTPDFEVARGRSTLSDNDIIKAGGSSALAPEAIAAAWVRMRRDFSTPPFSSVQYSFSRDSKSMIETLVLHVKEPKDLTQLSIEDSASAVTNPAVMLGSSTPVSRIRLERFGKPSVVLARCSASDGGSPPDQSAYDALFRTASGVMDRYRTLLKARSTVPEELAKVVASGKTKSGGHNKASQGPGRHTRQP